MLILKPFLCVLFAVVALWGFEIKVDSGAENNERFSIITLVHDAPFACKSTIDASGNNTLIECIIPSTPLSSFPKNTTEFFEIESQIINNSFHLFIKPRKKQAIFATFLDLKRDIAIPRERPSESKSWQIVGFAHEIPFLSNRPSRGLNFPIKIEDSNLPSIGELNLDSSPLEINEGVDFAVFLNLRRLYDEKKYEEAINTANEVLNYENSIFARDSLLYKIRALSKIAQYDDIFELANAWIKQYPADINVPEVLYILGDSYSRAKIFNEARYYFERIIDEYEDSKFVQYAQVGLAKNLIANGDKVQAPSLFAKAYEGAKDLDTASFVALEWGDYELRNAQNERANLLFSRVLSANPNYFLHDINASYALLKSWAQSELYEVAASAGDYVLSHMENDITKENLMNDVALWYELAGRAEDAHKINVEFLEVFKDSPKAELVRARDDSLLFSVQNDDPLAKIAQYDYLIETYPGSENAALAYLKKAEILFLLNRFSEVIALKNELEKDSTIVRDSYIKLLENERSCAQITRLYIESEMTILSANSSEVFNCLFSAQLFAKALDLSQAALEGALNSSSKLDWLYNVARASFALRDFNKTALSARDAFALSKRFGRNKDVGVLLFLALMNLDRKSEALGVFDELQGEIGGDVAMLEALNVLLRDAVRNGDNIATERYAKEMMALALKFSAYEYSPFTELSYADVLFGDHRYSQMLEILANVDSRLNENERAKVAYMRGAAYYELGRMSEARSEFLKCEGAQNSFGALCKEGLNLLK